MSNSPFSIVARDEHGLAKAQRILSNWKVSAEHPVEVIIQPYKKTRSQQQNALYWSWLNIIAHELGNTSDELHTDMKRRFLKPILEETNEGFRDILDKLRKAYRDGHHEIAISMEQHVINESSTSLLNTSQMTTYLERILEHAKTLDIALPLPEDRRKL